MLKQAVFSMVMLAFVSQAHAVPGREGKEGGKARDIVAKEEAAKANEAGSTKAMVRANAEKKLDQYLGKVLKAGDKDVILKLAEGDAVVRKALVELVKSKRSGNNALIDDAQTGALQALAKIPNLQKRIAEKSLTADERAVYKLVIEVPSKARKDFQEDDKAVAAEAIKIFADAARDNNSTLDSALTKMEFEMANHKDSKLKVKIERKKLDELC